MRSSCCKDCQERIPPTKDTIGCRATCEKWKEYEKEYHEEKGSREYIDRDEYFGYLKQRVVSNKKRYHKNEYGK